MVLDKCTICGNEFDRKGRAKTCSNPDCRKEYKKQYKKQYRKDSAEYYKKYRKDNAEAIAKYYKKYRKDNAEYYKKYRKDSAEAIVEYKKQRYEKAYEELSQIGNISIEDLKSYIPPMFIERELACWKTGSYFFDFICVVNERANGKCELTGKKSSDLRVHHLDGFNWCIDGRMDLNNSVCIDKTVHDAFHKKYGYYDNTRKQWEEFKANYQRKTVTLDDF